jgi:protein MPE1
VATIKFDGTGLTVFELKREIIMANSLLNSSDVDIILYSTENIQDTKVDISNDNKELADDNEVVPRSTTVLVRRTMAAKKGRGNVHRYVAGKPRLHVSSSNAHTATSLDSSTILGISNINGNTDEDDMIKKMFSAQDEQWVQQQDVMATATRIDNYRPAINEPVPEYYICYKCGEKGKHNIKNCPKNNDPNWEGVRVRKTTGIPKSYLKAIEKPQDGSTDDLPNGATTYMVNDEGKYVVAVADTKAWEKYQNIKKSENLLNDNIEVEDPELKDTESGKLWNNPVRTPCCNKIYSRKNIEDKLIDSDFTCPGCGKEQIYLDTLKADEELQKKADEYLKDLLNKKDSNPAKRQQTKPVGGTPSNVMPMPPMMPMMPIPPMNMNILPMNMNMSMPPFMPFMNIPNMNNNITGGQPQQQQQQQQSQQQTSNPK